MVRQEVINEGDKYRWYRVKAGGRQSDGFFVDQTDRILYWPQKKAPGYILDTKTAEEICDINSSDENKKPTYLTLFAFIIVCVRLIYRNHDLHEQFKILTENISELYASILAMLVVALILSNAMRIFRRTKIASIVQNLPTIRTSRPVAQFLKPSETRLKANNQSRSKKYILNLIIIMLTVIAILAAISSGRLGDLIITCILVPLVIWGWVRARWLEKNGIQKDQVELFSENIS